MPDKVSKAQIADWDEAARAANDKRKAGDVKGAARDFDALLAVAPGHSAALHGRARVALARGETDALIRFDAALKVNPGDADLWLGKAQALNVAGDTNGARVIAEQITTQAPGFIAALEFLAGIRLATGDAHFAKDYAEAAERIPQDPNIPAAHIDALAGLDHAVAAADVAKEARLRFPDEPHFALLEAANASAAGQWDRAEVIFGDLKDDRPLRFIQEARHRMRAGDFMRAETLLNAVLASDRWNISAWALLGIIWRIAQDDRFAWLHEQSGLVQMRPLKGRANLIDDATEHLRTLHEQSAMPLNQSLRGGTQTRGVLFDRTEPIWEELTAALLETLAAYRSDLPEADGTHPLLQHRDADWILAGSWSVRLHSGKNHIASNHIASKSDYHTAHIHPNGIISSALYCAVPNTIEEAPDKQGWLELGRPPQDLRLDLEPVMTLKPRKGHLALFPSTLYHGTTPFASQLPSERITTAFDVITDGPG